MPRHHITQGHIACSRGHAVECRHEIPLILFDCAGDLGDLQPALEPREPALHDVADPEILLDRLARAGHCSALVKVTGNLDNLLLAHSSWFTFRCAHLAARPHLTSNAAQSLG